MKNYNSIAQSIKETGFFIKNNFIDSNSASKLVFKINEIIDNIDLSTTKEYNNFIVGNNLNQRELKGPPGQYSKPVILTRGLNNFDVGLIEIFNAEKLFPEIPVDKIKEFIKLYCAEINILEPKIEYSIYINNKVTKVRGYHRDIPLGGNKFLQKLFIYLTDVPDISYGPHSYIPQTHIPNSSIRFANQLVGNYDDPNEYDCSLNPSILLGPAGTAILTTQDGLHRGLPQTNDKTRIVLVCKIRR